MTEEIHDYTKEGERVSEAARRESARQHPEDPLNDPKKIKPVDGRSDTRSAVDPKTGRASDTDVPRDPNVGNSRRIFETATNNEDFRQAAEEAIHNTMHRNISENEARDLLNNPLANWQQNTAQPQTPQPTQQPLVNSVIVSASAFESKKKSFLNPDVDNGFWDTLDKKLKEALSGNTADEIGQNMAFAALTFLFDAIGNWATHHRKEAKRVKKEYEEKTKAFDDVLKNTLVEKYGAVAEYAIKMGIDIRTPEGRQKLGVLMNNKEFLGLCAAALSTTLMREVTPEETKKLMEGAMKSLSKGNLALNSQEVANALGTQEAQDNAAYWNTKAKDRKKNIQSISQYRELLRAAENDRTNRGKTHDEIRKEVLQREER